MVETPKGAPTESIESMLEQISVALKKLASIYNKIDEEERPLTITTENYSFIFTTYGSDGGPSIEIHKKNPKKGEVKKITLQGLDAYNVNIWIDHDPIANRGRIGEKVVGSVIHGNKSGEFTVDNTPVVLPILKKFSGILEIAYKKREKNERQKTTDF